jgi:hypothetical protein
MEAWFHPNSTTRTMPQTLQYGNQVGEAKSRRFTMSPISVNSSLSIHLFKCKAVFSSSSTHTSSSTLPLILELRAHLVQPSGDFTPDAAVLVTPSLRESGLLAALSPQEWHTLSLLLACVTANGDFIATADSLATSVGIGAGQMRARLAMLFKQRWRGEPLLRVHTTESGLRLFMPAPGLFAVRHCQTVSPGEDQSPRQTLSWNGQGVMSRHNPIVPGATREEIVKRSRATYARPRAEVEGEINFFLRRKSFADTNKTGIHVSNLGVAEDIQSEAPLSPETLARQELERRLLEVGLSAEQVRRVQESYSAERIERQLDYLGYRHARHPAGMLLAAIEGDYEAPVGMRPQPMADGGLFVTGEPDGAFSDALVTMELENDADEDGTDKQGGEGRPNGEGSALFNETPPAFETEQAMLTEVMPAYSVNIPLPPDGRMGEEVASDDSGSSEVPGYEF